MTLEDLFTGSVEEAVRLANERGLCLVVYNAVGPVSASDGAESDDQWLNQWFKTDEQDLEKLKRVSVWLKLVKGSQQFGYFEQLFPNVKTPSVYLVHQGQIKLILEGADGDANWGKLVATLDEIASKTKNPAPVLAGSNETPVHEQPKKNETFKEQVQRTARESYQKEVTRERKLAMEERDRILRLVQADKEERKAREHMWHAATQAEQQEEPEVASVLDTNIHDNIKNRSILNKETCILQIKLTDSTNLKNTFSSKDTLNDVRTWVDANRTDGTVPYAFHRNVPRFTFQESDELKTLTELELEPRSSLLLKPLDIRARRLHVVEVDNPGLFGKVYSNFSSWWNTAPEGGTEGLSGNCLYEPMPNFLGHNSTSTTHLALDGGSSSVNLNSRPVSPNVVQFHNTNDERDEDEEKETYNGNAVKLEKRDDDDKNK
ncbi:Ubx6p KNAG_0E02680 [Huiozyma naganishii CBS 8797]|uniref:UBX domain-containing protein n=1 Tax=Huiozyma naganishii (strain ATCC MYA-139 / BCRC 22969 / CBS 8797 / KCTC 17520 / NBRC 10181 / NCYC 3082 / Yp74L-3) TaxID=1071383 RepID=J7RZA5_HUIN7|nr:hypothetical protein KNAG_0E02680 [Kazachstania naganishii CBS 8797]CCK70527.1 hypothetical protein KNAG_0E02680 [Kazachstania naganishii CBS 8797]